jgi:exodeoxyribonuclease VII small subunit
MSSQKGSKKTKKWKFEESLANLQEIIEALEGGELGLEESIDRYSDGVEALKRCYAILKEAEQKIEMLTKDGGVVPFEPRSES